MDELSAAAAQAPAPSPQGPGLPALHSALYRGWVRHRRLRPHAHSFRYPLYQLYLDLDELDRVFAGRWLWSVGRRNLAAFHRADFHGPPVQDLRESVRDTVEAACGERPMGPIRLLTHLRYFGYSFNPVSFYYCHHADGHTLHSILAEITNTPWRERHSYVLPIAKATHKGAGDGVHVFAFDKRFHVSPFLPMNLAYDWRFSHPGQDLRVHMNARDECGQIFDATLVLERAPISARALAGVLGRFPLMSAEIWVKIYWNALLIRLKQNPFYAHPEQGH